MNRYLACERELEALNEDQEILNKETHRRKLAASIVIGRALQPKYADLANEVIALMRRLRTAMQAHDAFLQEIVEEGASPTSLDGLALGSLRERLDFMIDHNPPRPVQLRRAA